MSLEMKALIGIWAVVAAVGMLGARQIDQSYLNAAGERAMRAQAPKLLADLLKEMRYEDPFVPLPLQPMLTLEGSTSTILFVEEFDGRIEEVSFITHQQSTYPTNALLKTQNGRYFIVGLRYTFETPGDCRKPASCAELTKPKRVSTLLAKDWLFKQRTATHAEYERAFGEPMPPRRIPA